MNNSRNRGRNLSRRNFGNKRTSHSNRTPISGNTGWCTPTVIYLTLSVLGIVFSGLSGRYERAPLLMLGEVLLSVFWTSLFYFFCSMGYSGVSWFLLLVPVILIFLLVVYEASVLSALGHEEKSKEVHIKRTYNIYY